MIIGGITVTWLNNRSEAQIERRPLSELPSSLGDWNQTGTEVRFDQQIEDVLRTSDYTMRDYARSDGRIANIYIGYYLSQRTGATYHSPQNCMPGSGWIMKDPRYIEITRADGGTFTANQYTVENGPYREVMIYWYQGRGRTEASEYRDKLNTVWDSITRSRSDGAFIRIMTGVVGDEAETARAAADLSARLAETIPPFVPE
jgi:EpsI family protein